MTNESLSYKVHLPVFEGPFDLLLFFIERDEVDIYDIPIAKITDDFLGYILQMDEKNIELASEFILVAGTLMRIKARMLIPRPVVDESGNEIDPRMELARQLLEYKRYKLAVEELSLMEEKQLETLGRGGIVSEEKHYMATDIPQEETETFDLYLLMRTFQKVWEKHQKDLRNPHHVIEPYPYTVEQVRETLLHALKTQPYVPFVSFVLERGEKIFAVFSFLLILEMIQLNKLRVIIEDGFNNFRVLLRESEPIG